MPIPPYILGEWLGGKYGVVTNPILSGASTFKKLNLVSKKVPRAYIYSSIEQRLELLAGLLDARPSFSGSSRSNIFCFASTNRLLVDSVKELLRTLGLRPIVNVSTQNSLKDEPVLVYNISFVSNIKIPTRLSGEQQKKVSLKKVPVTDVLYSPGGERGNCITVDSDDGLYLVGKKLIPTHNSVFFSQILNIYDMFLFPHRRIIIESASQEQAEALLEEIKRIVDNNEWLASKKNPDMWRAGKLGYNAGYILGKGFGSEILGQHVDRICVDDILRSDNKLTDEEVEDFIDMTLEPMLLNRKGQMIIVGTPRRETDIFSNIFDKIKQDAECPWILRKFPAVLDYDKKLLQCRDRFTWKEIMDKSIEDWKAYKRDDGSGYVQMDDILVIGVRV